MRPPKVSSFLCRLRFVDHKQNQKLIYIAKSRLVDRSFMTKLEIHRLEDCPPVFRVIAFESGKTYHPSLF